MADLGNLQYGLTLNDSDFNQKLDAALKRARQANEELGRALDFKLSGDLKKQLDDALKGKIKIEGIDLAGINLQSELDSKGYKIKVLTQLSNAQELQSELDSKGCKVNVVAQLKKTQKLQDELDSREYRVNVVAQLKKAQSLQTELDSKEYKVKVLAQLSKTQKLQDEIKAALGNQKYKYKVEFDYKDVKANIKVNRQELLADIRDTLKNNQFNIHLKTSTNVNRMAKDQARIDALEALTEQRRARTLAIQSKMNQATSQGVRQVRQYNTEVDKTVSAYSRLKSMAAGFMGTFGAGMLLQSLIRIRGEFEQSYIALKAIVQSGERASETFSQLQTLAVKSPFQFSQLANYTKMLSAYQIPTEELFGTTKRLSDLSAGLGVDMSRIILAYGQVRAATVLKGTELRQFTEAGIPLVQMLADKYSELEGKVVSSAEVFDRISKREVPFADVKDILTDLTNEGGRFYNMQEKLADTLKGKVSNLTDAYEIMMNKIGTENSGILKGGVDILTSMMSNYQSLITILTDVAVAYGAYRTQVLMANLANKNLTAEIGESKAALLEQELAAKKLAANRLSFINGSSMGRIKDYTDSQKYLLATQDKLTNADIRQLAYKGKINTQDAERLFLEQKITEEQLKQVEFMDIMKRTQGVFRAKKAEYMYKEGNNEALATQRAKQDAKVYREEQVGLLRGLNGQTMRTVDSTSKLKRIWNEVGPAIGGALKSMAKASVFMAIIGLVTDLGQAFMSMGEQIAEANKKMQDFAKDNYDSLAMFLKEYKNLIDALNSGKLGGDQADKLLERSIDELKKVAPIDYAKFLVDAEGLNTTQEKAKAVLETLRKIKDTAEVIAHNDAMPKFAEDFGIWRDGLQENLADYQKIAKLQEKTLQRPDKNGNVEEFDNYKRTKDQLVDFAKGIEDKLNELRIKDPVQVRAYVEEVKKALIDGKEGIGEEAKNLMNVIIDNTLIGDGVINKSTATYEGFFNSLLGEDRETLRAMANNWTTANEAKLKTMLEQYLAHNKSLYGDAKNLTADISQLVAYIKVRLQVETSDPTNVQKILAQTMTGSGELADVPKWIKDHPAINAAIKDAANVADALGNIAKVKKALEETIRRSKKVAGGNKLQQEEISSMEERLEELKEAEKIFGDLNQFNETSSRGGSRGGTEKDTITEAIKQKFSQIEDAIKEYEKLAKQMSRIKALGELSKMDAYKFLFGEDGNLLAEFQNYFKEGGMLELIKATKLLKGGKDKPKFDIELTKKQGAIEQEEILRKLSAALSELTENAKIGEEQWKSYQDALGKTGNVSLAQMVAFKDSNVITSMVDFQKGILDKMLKLGGYNTNGKTGFDYMLGMDKESLKKMNSDIVKFFEDIKSTEKKQIEEMDKLFLDVFEESMNMSQKIAKIEAETAKKIKAINAQGGLGRGTREALINRVNADAGFEKLKLSSDYVAFFDGIYSLTQTKVQAIGNAIRDNLDKRLQAGTISAKDYYDEIEKIESQIRKFNSRKSNTATYLTGGIQGLFDKRQEELQSEAVAKAEEIRKIEEDIQKAKDEGNLSGIIISTARLANAQKEQKVIQSTLANSIKISGKFKDTLSMGDGIVQSIMASWEAIKSMGDALGADTESGVWADIGLGMELLDGLSSSIQSIASGDLSGAVTLFTTPITAIAKWHDNKLQKEIEKSQRMVTEIKAMATDLERYMNRTLGSGAVGSNLQKQLSLLTAERTELMKQKQAEIDKKKSDKDAIQDMTEQIAELDDQIRYFAEDTLAELYDIDLKSWASQISDSIVDAFASGEDAVKAFDKTVGEMVKSVVSKFIAMNMIEPALDGLRKYLFDDDGKGGVFGSDYELDENEIVGMGQYLQGIANAIPAAKSLYEKLDQGLKEYGVDMSADSSSSGLSGSIQSITEDQADLLASYVNGIRADVAMIRAYYSQKMTSEGGDVISTISVNVAQIAANTLRSANNTDEIKNMINSVITTTPNGKKLRV